MEVFNIIELLANNNSRLYKLEVLGEQRSNKLLKKVIELALDPFTQFYIRKIPKYEPALNGGCLNAALDSLSVLSKREKTGNAGIEHLTQILSSLSAPNAKIIEKVIAKDLKCGVSVATVNEIWPGFIAEYPVMLASKMEPKTIEKMSWPAYAQLKLDGMRFNAIVRGNSVEFRSRNGKEIHLLGHLEEDFKQMTHGYVHTVYDGELVVAGDDGLLDRQTGNGILNKAVKGTISDSEASKVRAVIWDYIPYGFFVGGHCPLTYDDRLKKIGKTTDKVKLIDSHEVKDIDEANKIFNEYLEKGEEGIILKSKNHTWENKRSKDLIKFKAELDCDLRVVGWEEGKGRNAGLLGALICESEDGLIKVNVGSGLTDENRKTIKEKDILGKIITIKYNARIKGKNKDESLFLPIFIEVREDKDKADYSGDIK